MTLPSDPADLEGREPLGRVFRRARMMNLLHEALLGAAVYKDLYRVIVAASVWPTAIDFSRAALFRLDPAAGLFRGCGGFGVETPDHHHALRAGVMREHGAFERTIFAAAASDPARASEQALFAQSGDPVDDTFWRKLSTEFEEKNTLLPQVRRISIPLPRERDDFSIISRLMEGKGSFSLRLAAGDPGGLPPEVRELLPCETLWCVIRTGQGPTLLLAVDNCWDEDPGFDEFDIIQMDWFCAQAALALEKIEALTELRRGYETIKAVDQMKSTFLSTISHELRTPLTGIMGFTRLLLGGQLGPVPENQRDILARVKTSAEKLRDIINDLIELAEIDAGMSAEVRLDTVDPLALVIEAMSRLDERCSSRKARIEPAIEGAIPAVTADRRRLGRVLHHLMDNAVKFGPEGGVVRVAFEPLDGALAIRIIDEGIGIEPDRLERIFRAFYQGDDKLERTYPGMGIGLAVCTRLMQGTGGRLDVKSRVGEGSTFSVICPLARA